MINRTITSKERTEVAGIQEELQTAIEALKIDYHTAGANGTIGAYIASNKGKEDLQKAVGQENTITVNGNKITYKGQQFTIDDTTGKVTNSGVATVAKTWTQTGDSITDGEVTLKVGDYVNYNPMSNGTTGTTYTSYSATNASSDKNSGRTSGYSSDQAFDASKYVDAGYRWRVLDIKNGNIRLIAEEPFGPGNFSTTTKTEYYLSGEQGYINGVNELKAICSIFGNGKGAVSSTSITAKDILDITGYNPSNPKYEEGRLQAYGSTITYTKGEGDRISGVSTELHTSPPWAGSPLTISVYSGTFYYLDGTSFSPLTSGSVDITNTAYSKVFVSDSISDSSLIDEYGMLIPKYELLFGKRQYDSNNDINRDFSGATAPSYWVADSFVTAYDDTEMCPMYGIAAIRDGRMLMEVLYGDWMNEYTDGTLSVLPVVSIQSGIQLEWNNTDKEWKIQ